VCAAVRYTSVSQHYVSKVLHAASLYAKVAATNS
jgi:hypothetical protein